MAWLGCDIRGGEVVVDEFGGGDGGDGGEISLEVGGITEGKEFEGGKTEVMVSLKTN